MLSGVATRGSGGGRVTSLTAKNLPNAKNQEKEGENQEKSQEKGKKIRKVLSLCPSSQIGLATLLPMLCQVLGMT